jgi:PAS domain S-box-containing protein
MTSADSRIAEARLRVEQFEEFLELMPDGLVEMDVIDFRVTRMNAYARRQFGYAEEDLGRGLLATALAREDYLAQILALHSRLAGASIANRTPYKRTGLEESYEWVLKRRDDSTFVAEVEGSYVLDGDSIPVRARYLFRDITSRQEREAEKERLVAELQENLANVTTLHGLLPICAVCKNVRDDRGYWTQIESYLRKHTDADFSHGLCPTCREEMAG